MEQESQSSIGSGNHHIELSHASAAEEWLPQSQASHRSLDELRPKLSQVSVASRERPVPSQASGGTRASHWSVRSDGSRRSGKTVLSAVAREVLRPEAHPKACCLLCCRRGAARLAALLDEVWYGRRMLCSHRWCRPVATAMLQPAVSAALQPHQRTGARWLFRAHYAGGGILGDEPGLGKTLQALATVEALVRAKLISRVLIVVTAEMVASWAGEIKKFLAPRALEFACMQRELPSLHATDHLRRLVSIEVPEHFVVIISYEGLHAHGHVIHGTDGIDLLVADEAHRLRNMGAMASSFLRVPLRRSRGPALVSSRLLLTGTPLPNNTLEFVHLLDIAVPGVLGDDFLRDVVQPIALGTCARTLECPMQEATPQTRESLACVLVLGVGGSAKLTQV
ncbi:hypothetical protein AB1Y20_015262 [Prymnesium parvum]|uniref:Helicase ATP-binding domain-containing protein n=1 Tax=Prymnesium parvum TaxID=97485 RepID=A0AB34K226_PRYPA